jgi:hypothetical protein
VYIDIVVEINSWNPSRKTHIYKKRGALNSIQIGLNCIKL